MKENFKKAINLFLVFLKIGAFTFGGGYAMIPFIQKEIVEKRNWISEEEMLDMFAIAEATPGVIAVNSATFVGYKVAGVLGSTFATIGVVLPAFVCITIISYFVESFKSIKIIAYAFEGIRIGALLLIINACFKLNKPNKKTIINISITFIAFLLATFTSVNVILILIGATAFSIIYNYVKIKKESKVNE